jgi:hypothetical protein
MKMEELKMPEELTKMGYDQIAEKIINRIVQTPTGKTVYELAAWFQGYADCQKAILDIIQNMKDHIGR